MRARATWEVGTTVLVVLMAMTAGRTAGGVAAAEWASPAEMAGLVLWLDASDADTLTADGGHVREWRGQSGQGRHMSQPHESNRPVWGEAKQNNRNLISFDGTDDFLTGPAVLPAGQSAYTFFAVWRPHKGTGVQSVMEQSEAPMKANTRAALLTVGNAYGFNGESNDRHDLVPFAANVWRLTCLEINNAHTPNVRIFDNGMSYQGATAQPEALRLGVGGVTLGRKFALDAEYLDGDVAEIRVYDRVLSRPAQQAILASLDGKWGLDCLGWFRSPDGPGLAFDFEGETYDDWQVEGEAFGPGPARGTLPGQMPVSGFAGQGLVNNVDHIIQTDRRLPALIDPSRDLRAEKRYLNLPVKNGAAQRRMRLVVDGRTEREFEIELADADPDFWVFLDLSPFRGKVVTVQVDRLPEGSQALELIEQSDTIKGAEDLYREKLRPQFHFTTRRGWNNDPNGLVYYEGEYHLFYQHNPYGWNWGNMHWGHAVSKDLVHWEELPIALYPDPLGPMFSGSAVVDENNTAGFQQGEEKTLVCIYTAAGNPAVQCLAYSHDRGRTWTKYERNPVLPHIIGGNRDPKVLWYEPEHKWVMALYLDQNDYALFHSPDLKRWERLCDVTIPGTGECPEFFEIAVDGNQEDTRWVFYGGNGQYLLGRFDGRTFTPESGPHPLNFGNCFYASQTFNHIPPEDGRRIQIAWGTVSMPGMPFNQMMDFPVELTLRTTEEGLRLFASPVREIETLHGERHAWKDLALKPGENPLADLTGELFDLSAEFELREAAEVGFILRGVPVVYDVQAQKLSCRDKEATLKPVDGRLRLRLLVDRTSIEIFGQDGQLYMPLGVILPDDNRSLEAFSRGGAARLVSLEVYPLKSIWETGKE